MKNQEGEKGLTKFGGLPLAPRGFAFLKRSEGFRKLSNYEDVFNEYMGGTIYVMIQEKT